MGTSVGHGVNEGLRVDKRDPMAFGLPRLRSSQPLKQMGWVLSGFKCNKTQAPVL